MKSRQPGVVIGAEELLHLVLFELIAAVDHQALDVRMLGQDGLDEGLAEGAGAAGDEQSLNLVHACFPDNRLIPPARAGLGGWPNAPV
jgi:hypothetical protein